VHRGDKADTDDETAGALKASDRLAPWLGPRWVEQLVALGGQLFSGLGDVLDIELNARLRDRSVSRPCVGAEACLRGLDQRPDTEVFDAGQFVGEDVVVVACEPPVLAALDELANIAPWPALPAVLTEGGGRGLIVSGVLQDLSQARERWGQQGASLPSLAGDLVVLEGVRDPHTLELLSTILGEVWEPVQTVSEGESASYAPGGVMASGRGRSRGRSVTPQRMPAMSAGQISQIAPGTALVIQRGQSWGMIELGNWDQHPAWQAIARRRAA